ncbi:DUF4396 domain-containing protein [Paenibacillus sp. HB172176]|uniref:DUF4396 domain-containing protein n=1 Tax=Paenibacillus sp. HB172176 TaxID=2493690 RepID=UPI00143AEFD3|nr:DUF4396 domain-containing protein [Paenibacillus sp. HB172176]
MLNNIAYICVGIGILSAIFILIDIIRHPQPMAIMNIVWPINGLYLGPFAIWLYSIMGRAGKEGGGGHESHNQHKHRQGENHGQHKDASANPSWQSVFVSTSHCSSGCTLGDVIGAPAVFALGLTVAGSVLLADYAAEFILAYLFGVFFQVFAIKPMNPDMSWGKAVYEAVKADTLSLVSFEIGMFGWMAIVHYVLFASAPEPIQMEFWFMMQIAMILGAATSLPANWYLLKKGIKHAM